MVRVVRGGGMHVRELVVSGTPNTRQVLHGCLLDQQLKRVMHHWCEIATDISFSH